MIVIVREGLDIAFVVSLVVRCDECKRPRA